MINGNKQDASALSFLKDIPTQQSLIPDHIYNQIINQLQKQSNLGLDYLTQIFQEIVIKIQYSSDEFQIIKQLEIIQLILKREEVIKNISQSGQILIVLVSRMLLLLNQIPNQIIPNILSTLIIIYQIDKKIIQISLPLAISKICSLLIEKHHTKIQQNGLITLQLLLEDVLTLEYLNLQMDKNTLSQTQIKLNEHLLYFSENSYHSPTPKLCQIYCKFCNEILQNKNFLKVFDLDNYIALIKLQIRYSSLKIEEIQKINLFQENLSQDEYLKIRVGNIIAADLKKIQNQISKCKLEIDSVKISENLKQFIYFIIFYSNIIDEFQSETFDYESLINAMFQFFQFTITSNIKFFSKNNFDNVLNSLEWNNKLYQVSQAEKKIYFESLPSLNHDELIWQNTQILFYGVNTKFLLKIEKILLENILIQTEKILCISKSKQIILPSKQLKILSQHLFLINLLFKNQIITDLKLNPNQNQWLQELYDDQKKIKRLTDKEFDFSIIEAYTNSISNLAQQTYVESDDPLLNILFINLMDGIFICSLIKSHTDELNLFQLTDLMDFLIIRASAQSELISNKAQVLIEFTSHHILNDEYLTQTYDKFFPQQNKFQKYLQGQFKEIYQNYKTFPFYLIKQVLFEYWYQGYNNSNDVKHVLVTASQMFDKYYLLSDISFCEYYLKFLLQIFKSCSNENLDNDQIVVIRRLILQIHSFFISNQQNLQTLSFQCFLASIPLLSQQPLNDQNSNQTFSMDDGPNVLISDTLGVTFAEIRKVFVSGILQQQENLNAVLYFWKILNKIYELDKGLVFFQSKNIMEWFQNYIAPQFNMKKKEITLLAIKLQRETLRFLLSYFNDQVTEEVRILQGSKKKFLNQAQIEFRKREQYGDKIQKFYEKYQNDVKKLIDQILSINESDII